MPAIVSAGSKHVPFRLSPGRTLSTSWRGGPFGTTTTCDDVGPPPHVNPRGIILNRTLQHHLAQFVSHEGLAGLWSGTAPSLVLVSNPIIQFVVYETLKQALGRRHSHQHQGQNEDAARKIVTQPPDPRSAAATGSSHGGAGGPSVGLRSHEAFLLGAMAKTISTLVTYPLQLAQAKLRAGRAARGGVSHKGCVPAEIIRLKET